jgi:ATP-binding cassette subfamily B protein
VLIVAISLSLALSGQGIERQLPLLGTLALGAYRLLQPLQQCFSAFSSMQANQPSIWRLSPFLGQERSSFVRSDEQLLAAQSICFMNQPVGAALVEFQDLSFRYTEDGPWILRGLNLVIRPGERLAFVGTTGSGKSTTSDLILGLLAPTIGRVLVNGQDLHLTDDMVNAWKSQVAHVPQQIFLSDASFASNIAFGVPEERINHRRVREAAEQASISELIESKSLGYATLVGERGVQLSGGQRQRIGIARALYKNAQLLIFDEATSALDNQTEAEVMAAIESLDRNITIILIAHRLSTVERCDRVVLLEHGQIAGQGSFEELKANHIDFMKPPGATP